MSGDEKTQRLSIAKAAMTDVPAIQELASHYSGSTEGWTEKGLENLINDSQSYYLLVAKQFGSAVGYAIARFAWSKMHILDIAVKEDMRGCGIGRGMMSHLIDYAKARRFSEVYLEVRASNISAVRMYQSLSFKTRFRIPEIYQGEAGLAMYLPLATEEDL